MFKGAVMFERDVIERCGKPTHCNLRLRIKEVDKQGMKTLAVHSNRQ